MCFQTLGALKGSSSLLNLELVGAKTACSYKLKSPRRSNHCGVANHNCLIAMAFKSGLIPETRTTFHRASKFCHWFILLPSGGGDDGEEPLANMLKINRSKDDSPSINRHKIDLNAKVTKTGYKLSAFIPGKALNGWDVNEQRNIGFNFSVVDRELGCQTLAVGPELPISEDPSLWQTLELVE